jgi:hypothetical protein
MYRHRCQAGDVNLLIFVAMGLVLCNDSAARTSGGSVKIKVCVKDWYYDGRIGSVRLLSVGIGAGSLHRLPYGEGQDCAGLVVSRSHH